MAYGAGWGLPGAADMTSRNVVTYDLGKSNSHTHVHKHTLVRNQMHTNTYQQTHTCK